MLKYLYYFKMNSHGSLFVKHTKENDFISLQDKHPYFSKAYLLIV